MFGVVYGKVGKAIYVKYALLLIVIPQSLNFAAAVSESLACRIIRKSVQLFRP
jgi:hypothetical protein